MSTSNQYGGERGEPPRSLRVSIKGYFDLLCASAVKNRVFKSQSIPERQAVPM